MAPQVGPRPYLTTFSCSCNDLASCTTLQHDRSPTLSTDLLSITAHDAMIQACYLIVTKRCISAWKSSAIASAYS